MMNDRAVGSPKVYELHEGVYAVIGLYHISGSIGTNAGIIMTPDSVVFIDSGMTISSAEFLWRVAQDHMSGNEDLYLILTHHHSDHVFGMRVLREKGVRVIAHSGVREYLDDPDGKYLEFVKSLMRCGPEEAKEILGDVRLTVPEQLIDNDTVLKVGTEIHLLATPGHVPSELSVYHPSSKTLFAGDTIFSEGSPTTRFGGPDDWRLWISHLERLRQMDIATICPGHGELCTIDEIQRNIDSLNETLPRRRLWRK
ncbi:MAG: MBL fold metallo-hydrolase [Candidatus Thorarchaeota archaeon]|nr:MBL fold metallo-hydrolase [Candidatus Thorarchaeota archaeon]